MATRSLLHDAMGADIFSIRKRIGWDSHQQSIAFDCPKVVAFGAPQLS